MTPSYVYACVRDRARTDRQQAYNDDLGCMYVCARKKIQRVNKKNYKRKFEHRIEIRFGVFRLRNNDDAAAAAFFARDSML